MGLKLDMGFSWSEPYRRLFGQRKILPFLKELGFEAVETAVGAETQGHELLEHAQLCIAAGFRMSLHPYSEQSPVNPAMFTPEADNPCRRLHERLMEWGAEIARLQGATTIVNLHAAAHTDVPRDAQIRRSLQFFTWCRQWCEGHGGLVRVVVELQIAPNPDERVLRIGDRYGELVEVLQGSGVDACWDFGHAVMNHRRLGYELQPSEEFLTRVAHVHCHDIGPTDHQPLLFQTVPWREFLSQAAAHGFEGTVILEVPPEHYLATGGLDGLLRSAESLREMVMLLRSAAPRHLNKITQKQDQSADDADFRR